MYGKLLVHRITLALSTRVAPRTYFATKKLQIQLQLHAAGTVYNGSHKNDYISSRSISSANSSSSNNNDTEWRKPITAQKVWVQLYIEDQGKNGGPFKVLTQDDIYELAKAVYQERPKALGHCDAANLDVYTPGTEFPPNEVDKLRPALPVPQDTTDENPLRVVAPTIENQKEKFILKSIEGVKIGQPLEVIFPPIPNDSPTFTAETKWVDEACDMIVFNMMQNDDGAHRVLPLCLARCSRGGKTRALQEIGQRLKTLLPGTCLIYVTFNDFSPLLEDEQIDPVGALCRRIAFAALEGRDFENSRSQYKANLVEGKVGKEWVENWLGNTPCVLLIDELNQVREFGRIGPNKESLSEMLKSTFMVGVGRYFVFSSHVVSTDNKLRRYMDNMSDRLIIKKPLPLITSLSTAVVNLSNTLTVYEAIYYGLVPALIFTAKSGAAPTQRRSEIFPKWLEKEKISDELVLSLLTTVITGSRDIIPGSLMELMDVTTEGLVKWIPFHMVFILDKLQESLHPNVKITMMMRKNMQSIIELFEGFKNAKPESGDGWEALFVIVLLVRAMTGQSHETLGFQKSTFNRPVTYNGPFKDEGYELHYEKSLETFLNQIPRKVASGPQLSLYYPRHASFQGYDCFLVTWDTKGLRSRIIGYQLKEGKGLPDYLPCKRISTSYVIRGKATKEAQETRGWVTPGTAELDIFFGVSGKEWTPKKWKALLSQPPI